MVKSKDESDPRPDKMILTLIVVFVAIVLRDVCAGQLQWHWTILMAGAVICAFVFKSLSGPRQKM
ncbi:MAG TPA: hypothetical protein VEB86_08585 [Chryseosolibacter sp.]|nr:hypothetical protein [Chryseosolibacter sp.]